MIVDTGLRILDILLYSIHVIVIAVNCFFWIWKRTRKIHLVTISLTAFSWIIMGIWYGWGYCFLTDWEWYVKEQLGETDLPPSFIHYMVNNSLGLGVSEEILDLLTLWVFVVALILSVFLNLRDLRKNQHTSK